MHLADCVLDFACRVLRPQGDLLIKLFQGQGVDQYRKDLSMKFQRVMTRKPGASRGDSREFYILARGYKL
jgi:23S rRNA (uridine2552-2'-O)-methyltransferase